MILIKNSQRKIKVNLKKLKSDAQKILDLLDYADFDLGIWLTTNKTIHKYNKTFRDKDKPTDILSFPNYPDLKPGEHIVAEIEEEKNLGDLIISLEYVQKAAKDLDEDFELRLQMLLVHGICHLLGYDHIKDEDFELMRQKEEFLLKELGATHTAWPSLR